MSSGDSLFRVVIYIGHFIFFTIFVPIILRFISNSFIGMLILHRIAVNNYYIVIGMLMIVIGLFIMVLAELDMYRSSGRGTPIPFYNPPENLVRSGIYGCTRNPMYLGTTMEYVGFGIVFGDIGVVILSFLILAAALTLYIIYEVPYLMNKFGDEFIRYASETPLLLPRLGCIFRRISRRD